jgi:hypothetical protein
MVKIGQSISTLPPHKANSPNDATQTSASPGSAPLDISQVGAVAYRVEATENLCQVSSFFLQQHVDFSDRTQVADWLVRFKELDLRLVQWKKFLPERWKESNVSRDAIVRMDPNLTLAHLIHDTALILLHQPIAYPPPGLKAIARLPNFCSAETCEQAAVETSAITSKYLRFTEEMMVNADFVYCALVAAKALLVHSIYYNTALSSEFFTLTQNMEEMSRRWRGYEDDGNEKSSKLDLAGVYALRLREYHARCQKEPEFADQILMYSGGDVLLKGEPTLDAQAAGERSTPHAGTPGMAGAARVARSEREETVTPIHFPRPPETPSMAASPMARPPSSIAQHTDQNAMNINGFRPMNYGTPDNLMMMSDMLMGQNWTGLDRVGTAVHGT